MNRNKSKSQESGLALLMALFTLMFLAALGLALLGATDLETRIAANYRDKQETLYASLSGLQEARDRLIPSRCQTTSPTACNDRMAIDWRNLDLPTDSNHSVVYILNPDTANGETNNSVQPWDTDNKYFDSDLCTSKYFNTTLSGFCAGDDPPSGTDWYQTYYDTDQSEAGEYYASLANSVFPYPLKYKWVRITLKADNMTPVAAENPSNGTQMCWDGSKEVPVSSGGGYDSACKGNAGITLFNGSTTCTDCTFNPPLGTGYSSPVNVTFSGGGGTGATATATLKTYNNGGVGSLSLTAQGTKYSSAPTVTIDPPASGTTATATAQIGGASVDHYTVAAQSSPIGCYSGPPAIAVSPSDGGGSDATAVPVMSSQTCIAGWSLGVSGCGAAVEGNTYLLDGTGPNGSGFTGAVTFNKGSATISSYSVVDPGIGYSSSPTSLVADPTNGSHGYGKLSDLTSCSFSATYTLGMKLTGVNLGASGGGSSYQSAPTVTVSFPTQPPAQAAPSVSAVLGTASNLGKVIALYLKNPGSGYLSNPGVTISGPGSGGATATATATLGSVTGISEIQLTSAGTGYTSPPSVSISGGGSGASIQAQVVKSTLGRIYEVTSLAQSPSGSRTLTQAEVATPPAFPFTMPGALVLDSPNATINAANSNGYTINGTDANSCGGTALDPKAAIGAYDNPNNPTSPTSTACLTSELGGSQVSGCSQQSGVKSTNYTGGSASPDVENVYNQLGDLTTVAGVNALATTIESQATYVYTENMSAVPPVPISSIYSGTPPDCPTIVVNGDLDISGDVSGCGVLLVTGAMTIGGNYTWNGPIFVIGKGQFAAGNGGGTGSINGSLFVADTVDLYTGATLATLGPSQINFNISGGGGGGIQYDHCWSDNMIANITNPAKSPNPLRVLSVRTIY